MNKVIFTKEHKRLVDKLIKARQKRGLRQVEVAKKIGRTQSYISKIEAGQRRIDVVQLKELAAIYKTKFDFFTKDL